MFELQSLPWVRPVTAAKRREKSFRAGRLLDRNRNPRLAREQQARMSSCFYGNKRDIATNAFCVV